MKTVITVMNCGEDGLSRDLKHLCCTHVAEGGENSPSKNRRHMEY